MENVEARQDRPYFERSLCCMRSVTTSVPLAFHFLQDVLVSFESVQNVTV